MKILGIDHINITAPDKELNEVKNFYTNVLGFTVGFRPNFSRTGYWLYANNNALLHLTEGASMTIDTGFALDHIALRISDLNDAIQTLNANNITYTKSVVPDIGQTQLLFKDPVGLSIELNHSINVEPIS